MSAAKAYKIIDSCQTIEHIEAATKYVRLFVDSIVTERLRNEVAKLLDEALLTRTLEIHG